MGPMQSRGTGDQNNRPLSRGPVTIAGVELREFSPSDVDRLPELPGFIIAFNRSEKGVELIKWSDSHAVKESFTQPFFQELRSKAGACFAYKVGNDLDARVADLNQIIHQYSKNNLFSHEFFGGLYGLDNRPLRTEPGVWCVTMQDAAGAWRVHYAGQSNNVKVHFAGCREDIVKSLGTSDPYLVKTSVTYTQGFFPAQREALKKKLLTDPSTKALLRPGLINMAGVELREFSPREVNRLPSQPGFIIAFGSNVTKAGWVCTNGSIQESAVEFIARHENFRFAYKVVPDLDARVRDLNQINHEYSKFNLFSYAFVGPMLGLNSSQLRDEPGVWCVVMQDAGGTWRVHRAGDSDNVKDHFARCREKIAKSLGTSDPYLVRTWVTYTQGLPPKERDALVDRLLTDPATSVPPEPQVGHVHIPQREDNPNSILYYGSDFRYGSFVMYRNGYQQFFDSGRLYTNTTTDPFPVWTPSNNPLPWDTSSNG
jgi:hypothetical protein